MPYSHPLFRTLGRLRGPLCAALVVALVGCDESDSFDAESSTPPEAVEAADDFSFEEDTPVSEEEPGVELLQVDGVDSPAAASISFAGGIPVGLFHLPNSQFGSRYNGALRNIWPAYLLSNLKAIKARGGKVVLTFSGSERNFKDADGRFSLSKWKAQVNRYRKINFSSYIKDGTIIGHYLIDEPHDKSNWNGTRVSQATLEEMARYSKQYWPTMVTIVRSWPDYLDDYRGNYRYLDAAWAQYASRFGSPSAFLTKNVSKAKSKGLALIVGMNILRGGNNGSKMTASQVRSVGSSLLSSTYPCAFLSWQYSSSYLSSSGIQSAMNTLRDKARRRSTKTCRGS